MSKKENFFSTIFLIGLVVTLIVTVYCYRDEIKKLKIPKNKAGHLFPSKSGMSAKPVLFTNVGTKHLRLKLHIPCKDRKQKNDLLRKMPKIKNELIMSMSGDEMELSIKNRDFNAVRKHLLQVFNNHVTKPLEELYFESFFFD